MENKLTVTSRAEWRKWLVDNYSTSKEIWLIYFKKHTAKATISYNDSVEEAICFGWIDGIKKRIDIEKYTHRFTPRKEGSKWSPTNIQRAQKMINEGKMTKFGLNRFNERSLYNSNTLKAISSKDIPFPKEIAEKLKMNDKAWENFQKLAPSHKKRYILWLSSAKRQETKDRRLKEVIKLLEKKQKLGMK